MSARTQFGVALLCLMVAVFSIRALMDDPEGKALRACNRAYLATEYHDPLDILICRLPDGRVFAGIPGNISGLSHIGVGNDFDLPPANTIAGMYYRELLRRAGVEYEEKR